MAGTLRDKTLALAGIFQAASLADNLARRGLCDSLALETSLRSVLVPEEMNPLATYGQISHLNHGLHAIERSFGLQSWSKRQGEILNYAMGIIRIQCLLNKAPELRSRLLTGLAAIEKQSRQTAEGVEDPAIIKALAQLYVETLGTLPFRLQIRGNPEALHSADTPERIRASLLAGVRAAWLWHGLGGRRWHLLFSRKDTLREIRRIALEGLMQ